MSKLLDQAEDLSGEILEKTWNPNYRNRPTVLEICGRFRRLIWEYEHPELTDDQQEIFDAMKRLLQEYKKNFPGDDDNLRCAILDVSAEKDSDFFPALRKFMNEVIDE